jgi:hypothetical protein
MELVVDGVLAIQAGSNPRLVAPEAPQSPPAGRGQEGRGGREHQEGGLTDELRRGAPGVRREGHEEHEEHVNHERWLVSYADMLTLLFVLFVVLYSMSDVNMKKFAELAAGLSSGFGAQSAAFSGQTSTLDGAGQPPRSCRSTRAPTRVTARPARRT